MTLLEFFMHKKLGDSSGGGSGSSATLISKLINQNGTYIAYDDSADGYSSVQVSVPIPTFSAITKVISANGTYVAANDSADGYSSVEVAIPDGDAIEY